MTELPVETEQKICINCKHHDLIDSTNQKYRVISEFHICNRGGPFKINVVTGERETVFCCTERAVYASCGPEARYYEKKEEVNEQ